MDSISQEFIFILISVCPGFLIREFLKYTKLTSSPEASDFDKNIWAFVYSAFVLALNFTYIMFTDSRLDSIEKIVAKINNLYYLFRYALLTVGSTFAVAALAYFILNKLFFSIKNKYTKKTYNYELLPYPTVWEDILKNEVEIIPNINDMCIEILKAGEVVTQGSVEVLSSSSNTKKDILLSDVEAVRAYLNNDKKKSRKDRMFPKIIGEYYDAEYDFLIRVYDSTKWKKQFKNQ